jgi:hypothetical protein
LVQDIAAITTWGRFVDRSLRLKRRVGCHVDALATKALAGSKYLAAYPRIW